ncbi:beta-Ala-His dipeptidase [Candidatus Lokiarchaeum ossiferum]|uniref:beta-Ala-His dipeptidase n=1 Tax=Candidatus Lokiarchaeum ossiferum TaxID=2951803 RepID=UPI00352C6704
MVLESLKPRIVWEIFEDVMASTPHPSKKEEKIRKKIKEWVRNKAEQEGLELEILEDTAGNILVRKPASKGCENYPSLMMQAHMDMVCETDRPEGFDFDNNPIPIRIQDNGEWVDADGTTLGADDGIGIALGLGILFLKDEQFLHGPLEVLLTVDEETGLGGAMALDPQVFNIQSKYLINLDGGNLGTMIIGCAGGGNTEFSMEIDPKLSGSEEKLQFFELHVHGLLGGHSGGDIHLPKASANVLIMSILSHLNASYDLHLCSINGGTMHNAINRESIAKFAVSKDHTEALKQSFIHIAQEIFNYYQAGDDKSLHFEPNMIIDLTETQPQKSLEVQLSSKIIASINLIPHGVLKYSPTIPNLVETSNNLAVIKTSDKKITVISFARSSVDSEFKIIRTKLVQIATFGGWKIDLKPAYSGWKPEPHTPFLQYVTKKYEGKLGRPVKKMAIHAGLECGIFSTKILGVQMVSMLPITEGCHTPDERVHISSTKFIFELLKEIITDLPAIL